MSRNLKVLGLALVAVFALSAMVASAASASVFTTTSGATITGNQRGIHKFTVTGQTITCSTLTFDAVAPAASFESIDVTMSYAGCKGEPTGLIVTFTNLANSASEIGEPGKCWWTINANGSGALKCNNANVTINASPCVVHIPAQSFASGFTFTNTTGATPDDIDMTFNLTGLKATHTDGFLCPFGSSGESNEDVFEGESTLTAEVGETQVNATWDQ
jgi:hypothetical protein